jgi:hypothetical protein
MSFTLDQGALERQVLDNLTVYKADNAWFTGFPVAADKYLKESCWTTYENASKPTTKELLLGDTKIRSDHDLVVNFGLASANGPQEESGQALAQRAQGIRDAHAAGVSPMAGSASASAPSLAPMPMAGSSMAPAPVGAAAPEAAIPVAGAGSILSTQGWSPMLNDCFIMGGVHALHQFSLALVGEDATRFNSISASGTHQERWRTFITRNRYLIWNTQYSVPRVFARELIALQVSGYEPAFEKDFLVFKVANKTLAEGASLAHYCSQLKKAGISGKERVDEAAVVARVDAYLFGGARGAIP